MSRVDIIHTRPGDGIRARRMRRWARRELDRLLETEQIDPWDFATAASDPWHDTYMDRGLLERNAIGERMAAAGWSP